MKQYKPTYEPPVFETIAISDRQPVCEDSVDFNIGGFGNGDGSTFWDLNF